MIAHIQWFVDGALVLVLLVGLILVLWLADRLLGVSPTRFLQALVKEFKDLASQPWTTGSVNAAGLIAVAFVAIMILFDVRGMLTNFLKEILGPRQGRELSNSADPIIALAILAAFAAFSTFCTLYRERSHRGRR